MYLGTFTHFSVLVFAVLSYHIYSKMMSFIFFQIVKVSQYHTPKTNQNKQRFVNVWKIYYVCAKNGKNISNPLSFCNIYYIYRTYTYLLSFQVRQRHVQFNCLLTRDKIEFHESPFEENSERLYITSCEYVPNLQSRK